MKQDNLDELKKNFDKAAELDKGKEKPTSAKAKKYARRAFAAAAVRAIKGEDYAKATELISTSFEYDNTKADAYYYGALAYNKQEDFENAVKLAQDGIKLAQEDSKMNGNLQFELGNAFLGLGKNLEACTAYKASMNGSNAEAARYQIEQVLKCN